MFSRRTGNRAQLNTAFELTERKFMCKLFSCYFTVLMDGCQYLPVCRYLLQTTNWQKRFLPKDAGWGEFLSLYVVFACYLFSSVAIAMTGACMVGAVGKISAF